MISIIAALGNKNIIGKKNSLPWHLPADLKHFKEMTTGKPVIMGKNTYESIGKLLPNRINIILTSDTGFKVDGAIVVHGIDEALIAAGDAEEVMIMGGASVYKQFLPLSDKLYITRVYNDFDGDIYFPEINMSEWQETEKIDHEPDDKNPYNYSFFVYKRITTAS